MTGSDMLNEETYTIMAGNPETVQDGFRWRLVVGFPVQAGSFTEAAIKGVAILQPPARVIKIVRERDKREVKL